MPKCAHPSSSARSVILSLIRRVRSASILLRGASVFFSDFSVLTGCLPLCTGSSVGVKKVKSKELLPEAIDFAFQFDTRIMIEKAIDCREIECAVLGNESPAASILGEIIPNHEFYSYEAKYIDPNGATMKIPADIDVNLAGRIRKTAVQGYMALGCSSLARVDFFLDKKTNEFYLNEINTLPGFTSISMYPKLWEATGLKYSDLLDKLIALALDRHKKKLEIKTEGI